MYMWANTVFFLLFSYWNNYRFCWCHFLISYFIMAYLLIHLITQDTHNFDELIQSSWQNAPHCWHITMAFKEQAQLFASALLVGLWPLPPLLLQLLLLLPLSRCWWFARRPTTPLPPVRIPATPLPAVPGVPWAGDVVTT